jgi:hypothetical protein
VEAGPAAAEDLLRDSAEEHRRQRDCNRANERPNRLGAPPERRRHDVEPRGVERRVLRAEEERGDDQVGNRRRRVPREDRRDEDHGGRARRRGTDEDAAGQHAAADEPVSDLPGRDADHSASTDDEQQQVRERLADSVLLPRELDPERLDAREEVIARKGSALVLFESVPPDVCAEATIRSLVLE